MELSRFNETVMMEITMDQSDITHKCNVQYRLKNKQQPESFFVIDIQKIVDDLKSEGKINIQNVD